MLSLLMVLLAIFLAVLYYHFLTSRRNIIINENKCIKDNKVKCFSSF